MNIATHSNKNIPLALSLIHAGPASWVSNDHTMLDVCSLITKGREGFIAFQVTGDSDQKRIHPGDLIFVDTWAEPRSGQTIAVEINGLVCVKVFKHTQRGLYLVSRNTKYPPREIKPTDSFRILGVVKAHLGLHD